MDVPFTQAKQYLSKITASHFSTLNMKIANQNVLKRILIAMLNENKATDDQSRATKQEQANLCAVTVLCAST